MIINFKIFERYSDQRYMFGRDMFFVNDVMKYLKSDNPIIDESVPESPYIDNIINFFKEILMNKTIIFQSEDITKNHPTIKGDVEDVGSFSYKDEFYIKVKLKNPKILIQSKIKIENNYIDYKKDDEWFLIKGEHAVHIYNYDADTKPLHKIVKIKKEAEKYNI